MKDLPVSVEAFLSSCIRRVRRIYLLRGLAVTLATFIAGSLIVMAIDAHFTILSDALRWNISVCLYLSVLLAAFLALARPLLRRLDNRRMAKIVDALHPENEECLMTIVELVEAKAAKGHADCSEALMSVLAEKADRVAAALDPDREFTSRTIVKRLRILLALAALLVVSFAIFPGLTGRLFVRAVAPWVDIGNLYSRDIEVTPGDTVVLVGSVVRIEARVAEALHADPLIRISRRTPSGWGEEFAEEMKEGVYEATATLEENEWRYRISAGPAVTRYFTVHVRDVPRYSSFSATVEYPAYVGMPPVAYSNEDVNTIQAVAGSKVTFEVVPAEADVTASVMIGGESRQTWLMVTNEVVNWSLKLTTVEGFESPKRGGLLKSVIDQPPTVVVESPGGSSLSLPAYSKFPLVISASDDIAIATPVIRVRKAGNLAFGSWREIANLQQEGPSLWRAKDEIDLSTLDLSGLSQVEFDVVVDDLYPRELGGPHSATSTPFVVRLESNAAGFGAQALATRMEEARRLFDEARQRIDGARNQASWNNVEAAVHETEEAKKRMEELEDRLSEDGRFADEAGEIRRNLDRHLKPAAQRLREMQFVPPERRHDDQVETVNDLQNALEKLQKMESPMKEHAERLESEERMRDLAVREEALAKAAEELLAEKQEDGQKLAQWKQLQEETLRETEVFRNQAKDPELEAARGKMEKAARLMEQLRRQLENPDAAEALEAEERERESQAMREAIEHEKRAEDILREAARQADARNHPAVEDLVRQAEAHQREAMRLLENAEAPTPVKEAAREAEEAVRESVERKGLATPDEAQKKLAEARRAMEAEAWRKLSEEAARDPNAAARREEEKARAREESTAAAEAAAEMLETADAAEENPQPKIAAAREAASRAADELAKAEAEEGLRHAQEDVLKAMKDLENALEKKSEIGKIAEAAENAETKAREIAAQAAEENARANEAQEAANEAQKQVAALADEKPAEAALREESARAAQKAANEAQKKADELQRTANEALEKAAEARQTAAIATGDSELKKAAEKAARDAEQKKAASESTLARRAEAQERADQAQEQALDALKKAAKAEAQLEEAKASGDVARMDTLTRQVEKTREDVDQALKAVEKAQEEALAARQNASPEQTESARSDEMPAKSDDERVNADGQARLSEALEATKKAQRETAALAKTNSDASTDSSSEDEATKTARDFARRAERLAGNLSRERNEALLDSHRFSAERALARDEKERARDDMEAMLANAELPRKAVDPLQRAVEAERESIQAKQQGDERRAARAQEEANESFEAAKKAEREAKSSHRPGGQGGTDADGEPQPDRKPGRQSSQGSSETRPDAAKKAAEAAEKLREAAQKKARELGLDRPEDEKKENERLVSIQKARIHAEMVRQPDEDLVQHIFQKLGWFNVKGAAKEGIGEEELKAVPAEYRDLVRAYFLKLSEE